MRKERRADPFAGGIFAMEVGAGWNVHAHAMIYGPMMDASKQRERWIECAERNDLFTKWYHVEKTRGCTEKDLVELLQYPVNPEKRADYDEKLLAEVEVGFSWEKEKSDQRVVRRLWTCGTFYKMFPPEEPLHIECPLCLERGEHHRMVHPEPIYDGQHVKRLRENWFDSDERWAGRSRAIPPAIGGEFANLLKAANVACLQHDR